MRLLGSKNPATKEIYKNFNQFVEKYGEIGFFVMKNIIVPCDILPKAINSFFIYYITDVGNDAFKLPIPMW